MKKLSRLILVCSLVFPFAKTAMAKVGSCTDPIKLGTTLSETGVFSSSTERWRELTTYFFDEINKQGGVEVRACGKKLPIEIVIYDDQSNPATAVQLHERMASVDGVDFFVGPDWTALGLPVSPVAEKHKIPMVMANVATESAFNRNLKYMWATPYPTVELWSENYFKMLESVEPKPKSIFFVTQDNPSQKAIAETWSKKAISKGFGLLGNEIFPASQKDFSAIVLKIRSAKPDIIYIAAYDNVSAPLIQQMRQQRVRALDVHTSVLTGALVRQLGADVEGVTGELPWYPGVPGEYADLVDRVVARAKVDLFDSTWTMSRIGAYLVIVQAIEAAGEVDREKVRSALFKGTFKAPPGPITFDERGLAYTNGAFTTQMQSGKVAVVWPDKIGKVKWPSPTWQ